MTLSRSGIGPGRPAIARAMRLFFAMSGKRYNMLRNGQSVVLYTQAYNILVVGHLFYSLCHG